MKNLETWLTWIKSLTKTEIDLNLDRVKAVGNRLSVLNIPHYIIIVGGTNGKGSTVAALEALLCRAGYPVASFTSPYLFEFNEQIRINGQPISPESLITAFETVSQARGDVPLTPFEFTTLAALVVFKMLPRGVLLLEVGLGGRLDAVNCVEPNLSIVTSVALDHMAFLGNTREQVAFEKAGIFRAGVPAISGDLITPQRLRDQAVALDSPLFCQIEDFNYQVNGDQWDWWAGSTQLSDLPLPKLALQNWSTVLMAVSLIQPFFPISRDVIGATIQTVSIPGRLQVVKGLRQEVYDVAHNPASVALLRAFLNQHFPSKTKYAVFSMLADKDLKSTILEIKNDIEYWFVAPLAVPRGASLALLQKTFQALNIGNVAFFPDLKIAKQAAITQSKSDDVLVNFGSFYTVSALAPH